MVESALHAMGRRAGVELLAFANLKITVENARTLWSPDRKGSLAHSLDLERRRLTKGAALEQLAASLPELFLDGPRVAATANGNVAVVDFGAHLAVGLPVEQSPRRVVSIHRTACDRLAQIVRGTPRTVFTLVRNLQGKRLPLQLAAGWNLPRGRMRFAAPPDERERLAEYVDHLFVRTLMAGLWARFARCPGRGCGRFVLPRRTGRQRTFCSTACRVRAFRDQERREHTVLRQRVQARFDELRGRLPTDEINVRLKKEFHLGSRELFRLLP